MRRSFRPLEVLTESLDRRLTAYVIAAGAAGVAVLAGSLPAEGEAVCDNTNVSLYATDTYQVFFPGQRIPAFNLAQTHTFGSSLPSVFFNRGFLIANTVGASVVLASNGFPADLSSRAVIGPSAKFGKGESYGQLFTYASSDRMGGRGNFTRFTNYVGVKFSVSGQTHYGWARMKVGRRPSFEQGSYVTVIRLEAVGFETVANKPIQVNANCQGISAVNDPEMKPQSPAGSLGALALGADGIAIWRQK